MSRPPLRALSSVALLGAALLVSVALSLIVSPPAWACDQIEAPRVTLEHLAADDLNQPTSAMVQEFRSTESFRNAPVPRILGAYSVETVAVIPGDDIWYQASISTIQVNWGQAPRSIEPIVHFDGKRQSIDGMPCGAPTDGPDLGERWFLLVTDFGEDLRLESEEDPTAVLNDVFGQPARLSRQGQAVQNALDSINLEQRRTSMAEASDPGADSAEVAASNSEALGDSNSVSVGVVPYIVGLLVLLWIGAVVQYRRREEQPQ